MNEVILLGAGASAEAGVPTAYDMTKEILRRFQSNDYLHTHYRVLSFVLGGLLFKRGTKGINPLESGINVEELFNAVHLLGERNSLEASPFVGSWHAMVEELDRIVPAPPSIERICHGILTGTATQIQNAIPAVFPEDTQRTLGALERSLAPTSIAHVGARPQFSRIIQDSVKSFIQSWAANLKSSGPNTAKLRDELRILADQQPKPGLGQVFRATCEHMVRALVEIVWIADASRVAYFRPIVSAAANDRLVIATLNYDNSVEFAASVNSVPCDTGITQWSHSGRFSFAPTGISLLKLHGSIEWREKRGTDSEHLPHAMVEPVSEEVMKESGYKPSVIFGSRNKLTAEGPFLDLLQTFIEALNQSSLLTVIGYSFGDSHINSLIGRWVNGDKARRVRIVVRSGSSLTSGFAKALVELSPRRVELIEALASDGFRQLYGK